MNFLPQQAKFGVTLADLRGAPGTRAPRGSKFFPFHAVFSKNLKNNSNFGSWRTPLGKILDPPLGKVIFSEAHVILFLGMSGGVCMMSFSVWLPGPMFLLRVSVPGPMFLWGSLSSGSQSRGVSVQWCLCPGGSLSMGGHYPGDSDTPSTVDKRAVRILLEFCLVSLWIWIQKEPLMFPHWVQLFSAVLSSGFEWKDELSWTFEIFTRPLFK